MDIIYCHYSDISNCSYIEKSLTSKEELKEFNDTYVGINILEIDEITDFKKYHNHIYFKIKKAKAEKYYRLVKKALKNKMKSEI